jgi:hypothetical protein
MTPVGASGHAKAVSGGEVIAAGFVSLGRSTREGTFAAEIALAAATVAGLTFAVERAAGAMVAAGRLPAGSRG